MKQNGNYHSSVKQMNVYVPPRRAHKTRIFVYHTVIHFIKHSSNAIFFASQNGTPPRQRYPFVSTTDFFSPSPNKLTSQYKHSAFPQANGITFLLRNNFAKKAGKKYFSLKDSKDRRTDRRNNGPRI